MCAVDIKRRVARTKKKRVPKLKYRMVPLLSGAPLLQTDDTESQQTPDRRVSTDVMIRIITKALNDLSIAHTKQGKKTTLLRNAAIGLLMLCGGTLRPLLKEEVSLPSALDTSCLTDVLHAATEEQVESISKHVKDATALRGHYRFRHAEVETIMKAAGFCIGVSGSAFNWEYVFVQGRQLLTADKIQKQWPGRWEEFCETMFPGLLSFKAQVDSWGDRKLSDHEVDCRNLAYVDWHLCECLLQDSTFHYYDSPDSPIWKALGIFSDPTTDFMVWHRQQFSKDVKQLQQDAVAAYYSICSQRGGRTVLNDARDQLGIVDASTLDHSRALLQRMTDLLKAGPFQSTVPLPQPAPLPPVPTFYQKKISFPKHAKTLPEFWRVYDQDLRQYFSPLKDRKPRPEWDKTKSEGKSEDRWYKNKDMLFEQEEQVAHVHAHKTKVADEGKAVTKVLDAWASKMTCYTYTKPDGSKGSLTLTASDCGRCFLAAAQKKPMVMLKQLKGNEHVMGCTQEFMRVFKAT